MNIKKARLKTDIIKQHAEENNLDRNVMQRIISDLDNKILEIDENKKLMLYSTNEKINEFYKTKIKIYDVMGWAILESELEFIEEGEN